ncbi:putative TRAP transporter [Oceanimonas sp. GK1]|jgi:TRAP-type C4-dicarboxylate transport system permease small subunit|uniref:TRAP transporter small permease n=1 Tax=Oceanimonas sp. (strain GK1 / IBRC-M 10197) TaxID=511062 RepID=UPI0002495553|nr:TRAP transporter small permease [Oceanimonas sp. GK1]AEY02925.1 putative TRAP transporter [Oceanimonas sp. GK1]
MSIGTIIYRLIDNIERVICSTLLATFVVILFVQIISRQLFNHSIAWSEELSTYMFVWFVYFGASYATKLAAHNRVTFQFKLFPPRVAVWSEALADLIWVGFNSYFVWLSYDFVFNKMNLFWKSQTLGFPMKYVYMILPIAFALMTFRILQVNYYKLVKGIDIRDPESLEVEKLMDSAQQPKSSTSTQQDEPQPPIQGRVKAGAHHG